jgi:replicative DNA helicase
MKRKKAKAEQGDGNLQQPHNEEAERYIIGSILTDNGLMDNPLTHEDFYKIEHRWIFEVMETLHKGNKLIDPVTLMDLLKSNETITFKYLMTFIDSIATTHQFDYYSKIVKEQSAKRKLIKISENIKQISFKGSEELSDIISQCTKDIQALDIAETEGINYVPDMVDGVIENIKTSNKSGCIAGIKTGFHDLDKLTGGWQGGRYYILGARPKMGKTSLFCQVAETAANQKPTIIFSLEMSKEELIKLLIYQNSKIDSMLEQNGQLTQSQFHTMQEAAEAMKRKNLYIDDKSRDMQQIRTSIKQIQKDLDRKNKGKLGLIVIDYVQMIHGDKKLSRNYQLEEISRGIKEIAKDNKICVLALSQLSREVDNRRDNKPIPSDLRDSGSFEQDCDGLMLMYRDAYYKGQKSDNTQEYKFGKDKVTADIVDINMFLNRHGKADKFQIHFLTPYRKFIEKQSFYPTVEKTPWD